MDPRAAADPAAAAAVTGVELRPFAELDLRRLYALMHLRDLVFVVGQKITSVCEIDGEDPQASHLLVYGPLPEPAGPQGPAEAASRAALRDPEGTHGHVIACARVFFGESPVRVGRIAVHPALQRRGVGTRLMRELDAALGARPGIMHAQQYLEAWYGSLGWRREGEPFSEAEIPHVTMVRR